eukprot:806061-Amorphochlora_amoeboformis.AAC.1
MRICVRVKVKVTNEKQVPNPKVRCRVGETGRRRDYKRERRGLAFKMWLELRVSSSGVVLEDCETGRRVSTGLEAE